MRNKIELIHGDITRLAVDAIVNSAHPSLLGGKGVDGAIHQAAGHGLLQECRKLGGCETGQAKITSGYELPASFVVHTVGPIWRGGKSGEAEQLQACYHNSLQFTLSYPIKTIAFPAISCGVYGYPIAAACQIAIAAINDFLTQHPDVLEKIYIVAFSEPIFITYQKILGAH